MSSRMRVHAAHPEVPVEPEDLLVDIGGPPAVSRPPRREGNEEERGRVVIAVQLQELNWEIRSREEGLPATCIR